MTPPTALAASTCTLRISSVGAFPPDPRGVAVLRAPTLAFESDYWHIISGMGGVFNHINTWSGNNLNGFLIFGSSDALEWLPGEIGRRITARMGNLPRGNVSDQRVRAGFRVDEASLRAYASSFEPLTDDRPLVEFPLGGFWRREPLMESAAFLLKALKH